MNYGMYLSANGVVNDLHRMDVLAHNLANAETPAFKPQSIIVQQRDPQRLESTSVTGDPQWLLERLGGGTFLREVVDFDAPSTHSRTNQPMDVAIEGKGFLVLKSPDEQGAMKLTRNGSMTLDAHGHLVSTGGEGLVMDTQNRPIRLRDDEPVRIGGDGTIVQSGRTVARLKLVDVKETSNLTPSGGNAFTYSGDPNNLGRSDARILQGSLEDSGVDPIRMLTEMIKIGRRLESNVKLMQYHDQAMGQAVNTLGRVT